MPKRINGRACKLCRILIVTRRDIPANEIERVRDEMGKRSWDSVDRTAVPLNASNSNNSCRTEAQRQAIPVIGKRNGGGLIVVIHAGDRAIKLGCVRVCTFLVL